MFLLIQPSIIVDDVAITMYGSALQRKYKNMWPLYNSRLPSVKSKSYLLIEMLNITVPGILPSTHTHTALETARQNIHASDSWSDQTAYILFTSY